MYFQLKDCNIIIASHVQNVFTLEFLVFIQVYEKGNFKEMFHYLRCTTNVLIVYLNCNYVTNTACLMSKSMYIKKKGYDFNFPIKSSIVGLLS